MATHTTSRASNGHGSAARGGVLVLFGLTRLLTVARRGTNLME
jgi:hypothetical protein